MTAIFKLSVGAAIAVILLAGCAGDGTKKKPAAPKTPDQLNIEMVFVEGGTFTMGCTEEQGDDCYPNEKPAHSVTVSSFYIGKYELTWAQWNAIMGGNHGENSVDGSLPVDSMDEHEVQTFIMKLNAKTGKAYRMPTEAEWEFAARGGNKSNGYRYAGSDNIDDVAWHKGNGGGVTRPVGLKAPNELGIYDMTGNVWECVLDLHSYYSASAKTNPAQTTKGKYHVCRGGSWREGASDNRISVRFLNSPPRRANNCGFRLVLSPDTEADTAGVWRSFEIDGAEGFIDRYGRIKIAPNPARCYSCDELDNIVGVSETVDGKRTNYYLTRSGKIFGKDSLYDQVECEADGFIRFRDRKTNKDGLFDRNGKVAVPADYDELGKVINGTVIALKDAEEECSYDDPEHGGCYKTGGNNMLIDTLNNVLIDDFTDVFNLNLDFFSMEKSDAPHTDTVRVSFPAKGGGYYSFIDTDKEFKRWLADSLEASLKADMLNEALSIDDDVTHIHCDCEIDANQYIDWHITNYWDNAIDDSYGKVGRRNFIVRNYGNLIREARQYDTIDLKTEYSRTGSGSYRLSHVTLRNSEMILDTKIYNLFGDSYFKEGLYKKAAVYYEKAIESDPDCAAAYYSMEESGKEKGETPKWKKSSGEAAEYFRKIIKPKPDQCAASFYYLGESYMEDEDGDKSKGSAFKKKAEELGYVPE